MAKRKFQQRTLEKIEYLHNNWVTLAEFRKVFPDLSQRGNILSSICSSAEYSAPDMFHYIVTEFRVKTTIVERRYHIAFAGDADFKAPRRRVIYLEKEPQPVRKMETLARTTEEERREIVRRINNGEDLRPKSVQLLWDAIRKPPKDTQETRENKIIVYGYEIQINGSHDRSGGGNEGRY